MHTMATYRVAFDFRSSPSNVVVDVVNRSLATGFAICKMLIKSTIQLLQSDHFETKVEGGVDARVR